MKIKFFSTGGTIDKIYFDQKSTYQVGESGVEEILRGVNVGFEYEVESIMRKDSLDISDEDRRLILERVSSDPGEYIVVTHGTDTMDHTARTLEAIKNKTKPTPPKDTPDSVVTVDVLSWMSTVPSSSYTPVLVE